MNKETLYTKFNSYRKPKFNLRTEVAIENDKKYIYKIAQYEEAREFIQHIYNSYKKLSKLNLPFDINRCELIDKSTLRFEYLEGLSLLKEFEDIVNNSKKIESVEEFKNFEKLLNKLPSKRERLDNDFIKIFGNHSEDKEYDLISPGILDLNLDNIIRDKTGKLHLIDYEWTFNFGIPKRYILYRTIINSIIKREGQSQDLILKHLEKSFNYSNHEIDEILLFENSFQNYVLSIKSNYLQERKTLTKEDSLQ